MKKRTTKPRPKAPAKAQKVDLSTLEGFAIVHLAYVVIVGTIALLTLMDIDDRLESIGNDTGAVRRYTNAIEYDTGRIRTNTANNSFYSRELYEAYEKKASKK